MTDEDILRLKVYYRELTGHDYVYGVAHPLKPGLLVNQRVLLPAFDAAAEHAAMRLREVKAQKEREDHENKRRSESTDVNSRERTLDELIGAGDSLRAFYSGNKADPAAVQRAADRIAELEKKIEFLSKKGQEKEEAGHQSSREVQQQEPPANVEEYVQRERDAANLRKESLSAALATYEAARDNRSLYRERGHDGPAPGRGGGRGR